ncbi:MAG TPA: GGDEF domain-containing protein [Fimbriimonadaceae bacterium]|nr:GGDEF domain-containing protein [Fimbriimonadaceae bacterium]
MQSLDALNLLPVWVNPEHLASTAKIILAGHRLKVLGVVEGSELVGIITASDAKNEPDSAQVRDFMQRPEWVVEASTPLRQLAETFWQEDLDYIPVVQGERFRGIITPNMLLKEMARSWDPLTGLSWSDRLREWGVENLKLGREITIIFIDLDDFGSYNKKYGHIVGDRVLRKVAEMIQEKIEPAIDLLVRYGGDEFAIGTIRDQAESLELSQSLREGMSHLRVAGSDEPVTFSIGVQGGKRTKERENVHYAATLDNLINLASKDSMAEKVAKKGVSPAPTPDDFTAIAGPEGVEEEITSETASDLAEGHGDNVPPPIPPQAQSDAEAEHSPVATAVPITVVEHAVIEEEEEPARIPEPQDLGPLHISEVVADPTDANSVTQVTIQSGNRLYVGVCPRKGGSVIKSVALATSNAISQARPNVKLEIRDVHLTESESHVRFISVIGTSKIDGDEQTIGGVGTVGKSLYVTVAEATLQAYTNFEAIRRGMEGE